MILCNVAALPDAFIAKLPNFLRQGGGVLIFGGDKFQPESYNQKLARNLPGQLGEKIEPLFYRQADREEVSGEENVQTGKAGVRIPSQADNEDRPGDQERLFDQPGLFIR